MWIEFAKLIDDYGASYNLYEISHFIFSNNSFLELLLKHTTITAEECRNITELCQCMWKTQTFVKTIMKKEDRDFLVVAMTFKSCQNELIKSSGEKMWSDISEKIASYGNTEFKERIEKEMADTVNTLTKRC